MQFYPLWKKALILGLVLLGVLFAAPNALDPKLRAAIPSWLPSESVNLGLDLRGGAHLLVEVRTGEVVAERMQSLRAEIRDALVDAGVRRFTNLTATATEAGVRITNAEDMDAARTALQALNRPVGGVLGGFGGLGANEFEVAEADQGFTFRLSEPALTALTDRTMQQSVEIIRRRVDEAGTREPTIQRQGANRVLIQVPGIGSAEEVLALIGRTAKLTFHKVEGVGQNAGQAGPGQIALPSVEGDEVFLLERRSILTGEQLVDSSLGFHPQTGLPVVNFRFDGTGARVFGDYTAANVGQLFAIVLDDQVISAPRIQSAILGGSGYIEGDFTAESATNLAILLRSGALPASISVLEQRTVGPDLGADSIAKGEISTLAAGAMVLVFMLAVYRLFGWFAGISLLVNVALILGILSAIGATLTLPGIAGIVLTIGMAVDANVIIYERIREELRSGKPPGRAIEAGYTEAQNAIVDANITTMIAAIVLFAFGSGPVKGFAVTLGIGVVTSVFTAVLMTRMLTAIWFERFRPKTLRVERIKLVPDGTHIAFMAQRRLWAIVSGTLVAGSIALVAVQGLNLGIDFRGGTLIELRTAGEADLAAIRSMVGAMDLGGVAVQEFGSPRDVLVRVGAAGAESQQEIATRVSAALVQAFEGSEIRRVEVVGPKVSSELLLGGLLAIVITFAAVLVYIWLRFEWQYSVAAIAALIHDVVITLGIFAVLRLEVNLEIIAAVLTIIGYSLNDTVVVFDRVRENIRKYKKMDLAELIDLSNNQTLSRTVMTAMTTLIALTGMYGLGPEVIKGFTFAMLWGVVIGCYSTIYIAGALLLWLGVQRESADQTAAGVKFGNVEG